MSPTTTREELLKKIHTQRRRLAKNVDHLTPEQLERPGLVANGWSAKDILSHLADWEQRYLGWLAAARRGETPEAPGPGYSWEPADMDRLNRQIYETHQDKSLAEVLAFFRSTHETFVHSFDTLSEDELFTPGYYAFSGESRLFDWLKGYANHDAWGQKFTLKLMRENAPKKVKARNEIIARLHTDRRRLENTLSALQPEQLDQPGVVGEWSVKDVLAHLAEWESFLGPWVTASRGGEAVETPAPGLTWKQLDMLNEHIFQKHRQKTAAETLAFFSATHEAFMGLVECMTEEEVLAPGYYDFTGNGSIFDWLAAYAAHDRWGKTKIRQWLRAAEG